MTLVFLSKSLNYNCFSPPRGGKWVPTCMRAEMILVIDLAEQRIINVAQAAYSPGSRDGLRNDLRPSDKEALGCVKSA